MALRGNIYALGLKVQTAENVPAVISTATDLIPCYGLAPGGNIFKIPNPEMTGTKFKRGDIETGRDMSVTFNVIARGPGGTAPPAADSFLIGRLLRAHGYIETVQPAPLLARAALSGGTTTSAILPVGASAVNDFYNGMPAILHSQGVGAKAISSIIDYDGATRRATFAETFPAVLAGDITIPAFLLYRISNAAPDLLFSLAYWLDKKRYNMINAVLKNIEYAGKTSNNSDANYTSFNITFEGDVHPTAPEIDEAAPEVQEGGNVPIFRDADFWLGGRQICGSGVTSTFQIETARPPCPGALSGGEAGVQLNIDRSLTFDLNEVLLSEADFNQMADQSNQNGVNVPAWVRYGNTSGNTVSMTVCDGRLGRSNPVVGGSFVTRSPTLYIDKVLNSQSWAFPYY